MPAGPWTRRVGAPRTVGGVCKVHVGSWECKKIRFAQRVHPWSVPAPSLEGAGVGVGVPPRSVALCQRWQVRMARCGDVCGVRPGGRVPCVAAEAVLESAVFERASCVCCMPGGRGCAHKRDQAEFWRPPPCGKKKYWEMCIGLCALFPMAPAHYFSRKQKVSSKGCVGWGGGGVEVAAAQGARLLGPQISIFPSL